MSLLEFAFLVPVSLFAIINPLSTVPAFLSITLDDTRVDRVRMARFACLLACGLALGFALTGQFILSFLGISIPALQIAGGLVLLTIAFDMLRAPSDDRRLTPEEKQIASKQQDVAVTPLAVPLLCGPGAISAVIVLQTQAIDWTYNLALILGVILVYLACFLILYTAVYGAGRLNPIALRVLRRIMGLLFAAVAVQFVVNGVGGLPFVDG